MLNKDLLDPKDVEIAKLRLIIEKFKRYDAERKAFYSKKLLRLGELESYVQELENEKGVEHTFEKLMQYKKQIKHLNDIIAVHKIKSEQSDEGIEEEMDLCNLQKKYHELKKQNKELQKRVRNLFETISELNYKLLNK